MKKSIVVGVMVLMLVSTSFAAPAVVKKFSASVSEIRIPPEVDYETLKKKKNITVEVPAIIFKKPLIIPDVRKAKRTEYDEINFLIEYMRVNLTGTPEDIAKFWVPEERAEKLTLFKDKEVFVRNREILLENPGLHVLGIIYQKSTASIMEVLFEGAAFGVTVKKIGNNLYLTDHPTTDLELAVIEKALGKR